MRILNFSQFLKESAESLLAFGARGPEVSKIQQKLIDMKLLTSVTEPTGYYGKDTEDAVKAFQKKMKFSEKEQDGIVGPKTMPLLLGTPNEPSTALAADSTKVAKNIPILAKSEEDGAVKLVGDTNAINPNASLVFNGLAVKWMVNGSAVKEWKAVSGLTMGNVKSIASGFVDKLVDTAKILYLAGKMKTSMTQKQASMYNEMGPTPPGKYKIETLEKRDGSPLEMGPISAWWKWFTGGYGKESGKFTDNSTWSKIAWGNYRAPLTPYPGTDTKGLSGLSREGFYIHGGAIPGSHGCIDLGNEMDDFAKYYITWQAATGKKSIDIVVDYKEYDESNVFTKFWQFVKTETAELQKQTPNAPGQNLPPVDQPDISQIA